MPSNQTGNAAAHICMLQYCVYAAVLRVCCSTASMLQHCVYAAVLCVRCNTVCMLQYCMYAAALRVMLQHCIAWQPRRAVGQRLRFSPLYCTPHRPGAGPALRAHPSEVPIAEGQTGGAAVSAPLRLGPRTAGRPRQRAAAPAGPPAGRPQGRNHRGAARDPGVVHARPFPSLPPRSAPSGPDPPPRGRATSPPCPLPRARRRQGPDPRCARSHASGTSCGKGDDIHGQIVPLLPILIRSLAHPS